MASRRMFSLAVVDTDTFLDLPLSAQALYFHLGLHGDDDGFVGSPRKILRGAGCSEDDLQTLCENGLVISFDSGVIVIRDWLLNNTVKNDRYKPTIYCKEMSQLTTDSVNRYQLVSSLETDVIQSGNYVEPQRNLSELIRTQLNGERFEPPSLDDVKEFARAEGLAFNAEKFWNHYSSNGWKVGSNPMVNWRSAAKSWALGDAEKNKGSVSAPSQPPRNDLARAERLLAERKRGAEDE